ncbi:MAG: GDSL-type esterase/lipase family protein, partial [Paludibacter sp.]
TNAIVFAGSSTIALWKYRIKKDMFPLQVIDRGFGGSVLLENIFYFQKTIKPYQPKIVVLYCENDITTDDPELIFEKVRYFENLLHSELPKAKLIIVSYKPSPSRKDYLQKMKIVNLQLKHYANKRPNTKYVDIFQSMMIDNQIDESLFLEDKLHMNDKGYDLWTSILKPIIASDIDNENSNQLDNLELKNPKVYQQGSSIRVDNYLCNKTIRIFNMNGNEICKRKSVECNSFSTDNINKGVYVVNLPMNKSIKTIVR